ncbi:8153_t:CDS:1, partial [Ambispora leptoticha]
RRWCRLITPILWSEPTNYFKDKRLISIYLLALNAEEQALLIPFKIILPNYPRPLFEYESYATTVGSYFADGVKNWLKNEGHNVKYFEKKQT